MSNGSLGRKNMTSRRRAPAPSGRGLQSSLMRLSSTLITPETPSVPESFIFEAAASDASSFSPETRRQLDLRLADELRRIFEIQPLPESELFAPGTEPSAAQASVPETPPAESPILAETQPLGGQLPVPETLLLKPLPNAEPELSTEALSTPEPPCDQELMLVAGPRPSSGPLQVYEPALIVESVIVEPEHAPQPLCYYVRCSLEGPIWAPLISLNDVAGLIAGCVLTPAADGYVRCRPEGPVWMPVLP